MSLPAPTVVQDFTAGNGTLVNALSNMTSPADSTSWGSDFTISANTARRSSSVNHSSAYYDAATFEDFVASIDVELWNPNATLSILGRLTNPGATPTYYRVYILSSSSIAIDKVIAGSVTNLFSATAGSPGYGITNGTFKVYFEGPDIRAEYMLDTQNGAIQSLGGITDSSITGPGYVGLHGNITPAGTLIIDNLAISAIEDATTYSPVMIPQRF